jgi:hypothetical protein
MCVLLIEVAYGNIGVEKNIKVSLTGEERSHICSLKCRGCRKDREGE